MKVVLQRVKSASVTVSNEVVGKIDRGYLVLLGVCDEDSEKDVEVIVNKLEKLRIFPDENDKINLSIQDIKGELLVVSQFTLYAACKKGNRPSFIGAGSPQKAEELYEYFKVYANDKFEKVECGVFGASMEVELKNDGPFTIVMEAKDGNIL
ncbi:MAG: D-aminoacyl-tRNA deacylase [Lachnospirales bacterium]